MRPKLTLITVTYNAADVISPTLDSILRQTYPAIEHIIIDGASSDNTVETVKSYIERSCASGTGHEVKLLTEPDNGIYDAMNKGIRMATGDYICFMNAGDALHDTSTMKRIADTIAECSIQDSKGRASYSNRETKQKPESTDRPEASVMPAVVYGETDIVDKNRAFVRHRRLSAPEHVCRNSYRHGMLVCHQAFFAHIDYARRNMFCTRYRFSADFDWCLRIVIDAEEKGAKIVNAHCIVADYLEEGATTRNHRASLKERFSIMGRAFGWVPTIGMHLWFIVRQLLKH